MANLLYRAANLLTLHWRQSLPRLYSLQRASPLCRRHRVQLPQTIRQSLLLGWRQSFEAGLIAQGPLLRLGRKILMLTEPLRQMLRPSLLIWSTLSVEPWTSIIRTDPLLHPAGCAYLRKRS